ncbi:MAG: T9SS type A sorting domain-containing protein [Bacteroidales bacterium]|nr:T9SS type A sorting domain-containing protein [Bacteroidales bacterium]
MKKQLLLFLAICLLAGRNVSFAQELVVDGNMENEASWTVILDPGASDLSDVLLNYQSDYPEGGGDGSLYIKGYGQTNSYVYQKVTLVPGHKYSFSGLVKSIGADEVTNAWIELILSKTEPAAGFGAGDKDYIYSKNSWMAAPYNDFSSIDGDFMNTAEFQWKKAKDDASDSILTSHEFVLPEDSPEEWFVVVKAGCWNTAGDPMPTFEFLFDNISLVDINNSTGVAQVSNKNMMAVYPNPSNGIINIKSNSNSPVNFDIYNVSGLLVKSGITGNQFDAISLKRGVYMIKLESNSLIELHRLVVE